MYYLDTNEGMSFYPMRFIVPNASLAISNRRDASDVFGRGQWGKPSLKLKLEGEIGIVLKEYIYCILCP